MPIKSRDNALVRRWSPEIELIAAQGFDQTTGLDVDQIVERRPGVGSATTCLIRVRNSSFISPKSVPPGWDATMWAWP
jgi:hypothetical protein